MLIIVTSLRGGEGDGRCAGRLLVYPRFVVSPFTTLPLGAGGGLRSLIVTLYEDIFLVFSLTHYCN